MSFGRPPPSTPYGDQDFIKEDFAPPPQSPSTTTHSPVSPRQTMAARYNPGYNQNVPYSTPAPPQPAPYNLEQSPLTGQRQSGSQVDLPNLVQSLTPEDQLFMQSWRRDSFFYRVLPLNAIAGCALYFYNRSRNLPQKTSRYVLLSFGAYIVGKWSYKGELRTRVENNPSNTPFMKAMRELMGVRPPFSELSSDLSDDGNQKYGGFLDGAQQQTNFGGGYMQPVAGTQAQSYGQTSSFQESNYPSQETDMSLAQPADGAAPRTSYEELRARNRGLIPK